MEYYKTLTEILEEYIQRHCGSIYKLAKESGIPYMTIFSVLKRGVENSTYSTVKKICEAVGLAVGELEDLQLFSTLEHRVKMMGDKYTEEDLFKDLKELGFYKGISIKEPPTLEMLRIKDKYWNFFVRPILDQKDD